MPLIYIVSVNGLLNGRFTAKLQGAMPPWNGEYRKREAIYERTEYLTACVSVQE